VIAVNEAGSVCRRGLYVIEVLGLLVVCVRMCSARLDVGVLHGVCGGCKSRMFLARGWI